MVVTKYETLTDSYNTRGCAATLGIVYMYEVNASLLCVLTEAHETR